MNTRDESRSAVAKSARRLFRSDLAQGHERPSSSKPGPPDLPQGSTLQALDQISGEGVAVVLALTHPVGCVTGVHEGHHGNYGHKRDEHETDQDHQQESREGPAHG